MFGALRADMDAHATPRGHGGRASARTAIAWSGVDQSSPANATVGIEPMGSHFVVTTVPGDGLAAALLTLPHVLRDPIREPHRWSAPAVPIVARAMGAFVAMHPWIA